MEHSLLAFGKGCGRLRHNAQTHRSRRVLRLRLDRCVYRGQDHASGLEFVPGERAKAAGGDMVAPSIVIECQSCGVTYTLG